MLKFVNYANILKYVHIFDQESAAYSYVHDYEYDYLDGH